MDAANDGYAVVDKGKMRESGDGRSLGAEEADLVHQFEAFFARQLSSEDFQVSHC